MRRITLALVIVLSGAAVLSGCESISYAQDVTLRFWDRSSDATEFAPMPDGDITRIAFGSCAKQTLAQPIWNAIAAANPDLFLFIGDAIYADYPEGKRVSKPSVEAIETSYRIFNEVAVFKSFQSDVPIMVTWDDHDMGKNDAGADFPFKQESKELMLDFFGIGLHAPVRSRDGMYHSRTFGQAGQRVQIIMLDTRWFRSKLKKTDEWGVKGKERYVPDANASKTMLGDAQWAWLDEQLQVPADLRLIVSSLQVIADGHGWEAWRNLPVEREKLYRLIESTGAEGVVLLSGDRHVGGLYEKSDVGTYPLVEMTSSSINVAFEAEPDEEGPYQLGRLFGPANFGLLEIDWQNRSVHMSLRDGDGRQVRGIQVPFDTLRPLRPRSL